MKREQVEILLPFFFLVLSFFLLFFIEFILTGSFNSKISGGLIFFDSILQPACIVAAIIYFRRLSNKKTLYEAGFYTLLLISILWLILIFVLFFIMILFPNQEKL